MKTRVDQRLVAEIDHFALRYACESCCYFAFDENDAASLRCCALGYPNAEHLASNLEVGAEVVFCKEFELT